LAFVDIPTPSPARGELLLEVEAAGICGTDLKIAANGHRKLSDGQTITLGHEFIGRVAAIGEGAAGFEIGQRVGVAPNLGCGACEMCGRGLMNMCPDYTAFGITFDGALAPFVRVPAAAIAQGCVMRVSDDADPHLLVLAEPLSCAINGLRVVQPTFGDIALVYGGGPMGLMCVALAALAGCSRVIVADRHPERLALAREIGATDTIDVSQQSAGDWVAANLRGGLNIVITAAPSEAIQREALSILAPFGRLSLFAGLARGASEVLLDTNVIHYKNLLVTGTSGGSPRDYRDALRLIESARLNIEKLVSHVYDFDHLAEAFEMAKSKKGQKIVISNLARRVSAEGARA
jgi:L-iditol 2-dehydrogenase